MGRYQGWRRLAAIFAAVAAIAVVAGCSQITPSTAPASAKRTVTDMGGRTVTVPAEVKKVVTLGSVPVLNSFIFAIGDGNTIVNGLPPFAKNPRYKYEDVFSPGISNRPQMQGSNNDPNIEEILKAAPDVVFTLDPPRVDSLEKAGLNVVLLQWRDPEDVKKVMTLIGQVYNQPERAQAYVAFFDSAVSRVSKDVSAIPAEQRPRVLYFQPKTLTQPHAIAEWWIEAAGGKSVTKPFLTGETLTFGIEQMLSWNPEVILVPSPGEIQDVYNDPRFASTEAVKSQRVYSVPIAAHNWGNRTTEQALTVLWAAKTFYGDRLADIDLKKEVKTFYRDIYRTELSDDQVAEIAAGKL
jgi:iron complex transport system substrate-binding protein